MGDLMDFSILYHVLWKPSDVFKGFAGKIRKEPFILLGIIPILALINTYKGDSQQIHEHPSLLLIVPIQVYVFTLLGSLIEAFIIMLIARFAMDIKANFLAFVSAFILCWLPFELLSWIPVFIGKTGFYIGLGSLFMGIKETYPFVFGVLASVTPVFIWTVILWRIALREMLPLTTRQNTILLTSLVLFGLTGGGLWRMFAVAMFNYFNPAS
jgi:hypothetical protein